MSPFSYICFTHSLFLLICHLFLNHNLYQYIHTVDSVKERLVLNMQRVTTKFLTESWEILENAYILSVPAFMQDVIVLFHENDRLNMVNLGKFLGGAIDMGSTKYFYINTEIFPDRDTHLLVRLALEINEAISNNGTH